MEPIPGTAKVAKNLEQEQVTAKGKTHWYYSAKEIAIK